MDGAHKPVRPM